MRTFCAAILATLAFLLAFLILAILVNAAVGVTVSTASACLSILPAPFAAWASLKAAFKILGPTKASKRAIAGIAVPVAILSALGGFLLPELERLVLNAAAGGMVVMGFLASYALAFASWALSFIVIRHEVKRVAKR